MRINRLNDLYKSLKGFIGKVRTYSYAGAYEWLRSYVEEITQVRING